jgi:hypothetical protein
MNNINSKTTLRLGPLPSQRLARYDATLTLLVNLICTETTKKMLVVLLGYARDSAVRKQL